MITYICSGIFLVFGSRGIGRLISGLSYDPESIDNHQFSVKVMLIITGVIAVILGAARWLALNR